MNTPKCLRGTYPARNLQTLSDDLKEFEKTGKNPSMAKHCNNVIRNTFFNIPIDQVFEILMHLQFFSQQYSQLDAKSIEVLKNVTLGMLFNAKNKNMK